MPCGLRRHWNSSSRRADNTAPRRSLSSRCRPGRRLGVRAERLYLAGPYPPRGWLVNWLPIVSWALVRLHRIPSMRYVENREGTQLSVCRRPDSANLIPWHPCSRSECLLVPSPCTSVTPPPGFVFWCTRHHHQNVLRRSVPAAECLREEGHPVAVSYMNQCARGCMMLHTCRHIVPRHTHK